MFQMMDRGKKQDSRPATRLSMDYSLIISFIIEYLQSAWRSSKIAPEIKVPTINVSLDPVMRGMGSTLYEVC